MDWETLWPLMLIPPALLALVWFSVRSLRPMGTARRWALLAVRCALVVIALIAIAGPAVERWTREQAVIFVLDHSQSQGRRGMEASYAAANRLAAALPEDTAVGIVSAGAEPVVLRTPETASDAREVAPDVELLQRGAATDLASAVRLAQGLFPPGASRRLVLVGDGIETRGDLTAAAREAAVRDVEIHALPVAGEPRPDVRVVQLRPSRSRLHEGGHLGLMADVESSLSGTGRVRLFENGIEVESRSLTVQVGEPRTVTFERTPAQRNLYNYRVVVDGFAGDAVPANDEALALVDVRGQPVVLYIEGEEGEARYLTDAMAQENIRLVVRGPEGIPNELQEFAGFDGVIFSDLSASQVSERQMTLLRDYVEQLGGGFLMIGGKNSFGVGGYYRTPIEEILPVKMKAPEKEERFATALMLVIDRSGSMQGEKIELAKSAAIATVDMLSAKDYVGVVAFDSMHNWVVPITRVSSPESIKGQISALSAGGGTNIYPGMMAGREALNSVQAKVKHMIVLTDGQTTGGGYGELAAQIHAEGVTISTVAVGAGADQNLLQMIAAAGQGQFYPVMDATTLPRIFTQDAMTHMGKLVREEAFQPQQVERHVVVKGWPVESAPALLGYVKTHRKATAQVPLVTDLGDPLLAMWRFGLGKVAAFTSDCKSRWGALWISSWKDGYNQFWAQLLREMARQPQGQLMDIALEQSGDEVRMSVDVLEDAVEYDNNAQVEAEVFFVAAHALDAGLKSIAKLRLDQSAPGRYSGTFHTQGPGVYLVRSRAGSRTASAGLVQNISAESATGQVNRALFERVAAITGGTLIDTASGALPEDRRPGQKRYVDLRPALLMLLILVFLADVVIRRWENVLGMIDALGIGSARAVSDAPPAAPAQVAAAPRTADERAEVGV